MARLHAEDASVRDYRARIRYRLSVSVGRRRWGRSPFAAVEEQEGRVAWQLPNDVRVDIVGRRQRSVSQSIQLQSVFDQPWFVPRGVGDSIRIFSEDFPAVAPLHPLASEGPSWYRYALIDSIRISAPGGPPLQLYQVTVAPSRAGIALITGHLWLDAATGEVVRIAFRYVGTSMWVRPEGETRKDTTDASRANRWINRLFSLDADLEYAREPGGHWMPYRQTISGRISIPVTSDLVVPFEAVTTFRDYEINTGQPIAFNVPLPDSTLPEVSLRMIRRERRDSLRRARRDGAGEIPDSLIGKEYAGWWGAGRFEMHRAPADSLRAYTEWGDSLEFAVAGDEAAKRRELEAELERLTDSLPTRLTGRPRTWFGYERTADALQFNRVQGFSLGLGGAIRLPSPRFTTLYATVRYGFGDGRVTGRLSGIRNGPGWKLSLSGYHDVADIDPFMRGRTIANTLNGIITGHDYGAYYLASGGSATLDVPLGDRTDLRIRGFGEEQRSMQNAVGHVFSDNLFPANPSVNEGTFGGVSLGVRGSGKLRWGLTTDALSGEGETTARLYGDSRLDIGRASGATIRVKAGIGTTPTLSQMAFRVGGPETVRGYDLGELQGRAMWSAQLDISPFRGALRPVVFADVGWAGDPDNVQSNEALVGAGIGVSLYSKLFRSSLIRLDVSRGMRPERPPLRVDLVISGAR